jgi:peptidoglycan/LPS O-acetylase OafA/YrhL
MAIIMVILLHGTVLKGGQIGVDIFFVLSGYLISSILMREAETTGTISLANFYMRRVLRLAPALVLFVIGYLIIVARIYPPSLPTAYADAASVLFYVHNFRILDIGYQHLTWFQWMISHCWSLSVEEQFYLVWPWLLLGAVRFQMHRTFVLAMIITGIAWPAITRFLLIGHYAGGELYFRTDFRVDCLMWGALVAWLTVHGLMPDKRFRPLVIAGGLAGLAFLLWISTTKMGNWHILYGYTLLGLSTASVIAALTWVRFAPLDLFFSMSWLRWVGKISYGLYLAHVPVFLLMGGKVDTPWNAWHHTLTASAVTIAVAATSFYLIEIRFLRLKTRFETSRRVTRTPEIQAVTRPA